MKQLIKIYDWRKLDLNKPYVFIHEPKIGGVKIFVGNGRDILQTVIGTLLFNNPYLVENGIRTGFSKPDCTKQDINKFFADILESGIDFNHEMIWLSYEGLELPH